MTSVDWWTHALGWGGAACLLAAAVLIAVVMYAPYGFLHDFPDDIRAAAPAPTDAQRRAGRLGGLVFVVTLFSGIIAVTATWGAAHPDASWLSLAAMALLVLVLFTLVDIVIVDWLVVCLLRPARMVFPGTEACAGWGDYGFHVRAVLQVKALVALLVPSALIGTVVWLLT